MSDTCCLMDGNQRITLPKEIRRALLQERKRYVVLHPDKNGTVIVLLPSEFDRLAGEIRRSRRGIPRQQLLRAFFAAAMECVPDSRGRVTLHPYLWQYRRQPKCITLRIGRTSP